MTWLKSVPAWVWALLVGLVLIGAQQYRIAGLQGDLETERQAMLKVSGERDACRTTRANMEALVGEQNQAIADLSARAEQRREAAQRAQREAQREAQADYRAANRLQQEHTGGDACAAAEAVINQELGL